MTQAEALVQVFRSGASMEHIAALLQEPLVLVEFTLRQGLNGTQPEPVAVPVESAGATAPRAVRTEAADSSPRPVRRKKAAAPAKAADDFIDYPEEIRHHLNVTGRAIYDALRTKPQTVIEIYRSTGIETNAVSMALKRLRDKNLVRGSEDMPVIWRLA
jgi:DNA-binding transcriptional ArsR family regulator